MKKIYKKPNVKVSFLSPRDFISNSNDLEIDLKRGTAIDNEEKDASVGYLN